MKLDKHMIRAGAAKIGGGSTFTTRERLEMSRAIITAALAHLPAGSVAVKPDVMKGYLLAWNAAYAAKDGGNDAVLNAVHAAMPAPPSTPPAANVQDEEPEVLRRWREDQLERVRDGSFLRSQQAPTVAVPDEGERYLKIALAAIAKVPGYGTLKVHETGKDDDWRFRARLARSEALSGAEAQIILDFRRARAEQREAPSAVVVVGEDALAVRVWFNKAWPHWVVEHGGQSWFRPNYADALDLARDVLDHSSAVQDAARAAAPTSDGR